MKKELQNVRIQLCRRTGKLSSCLWILCHVMALFYEIAEYSLNQPTEVPQEKPNVLRKWTVPGNYFVKKLS